MVENNPSTLSIMAEIASEAKEAATVLSVLDSSTKNKALKKNCHGTDKKTGRHIQGEPHRHSRSGKEKNAARFY